MVIFRTYSNIPGQFPDIFVDIFWIFIFYRANGLMDLISAQKNLKYFGMMVYYYDLTYDNLTNIIPSLIIKLPNTIVKLDLYGGDNYFSLSFIINFKNLQVLQLSFFYNEYFKDFEKLQYAIFPQLQVLIIKHSLPKIGLLIKFLEVNGKNLKELCLGDMDCCSDDSLNLAIAKFCTNLRKLSTGFESDELETLEIVFNSCQYLESIKIWCGDEFLSEKETLEAVAKFSQKFF